MAAGQGGRARNPPKRRRPTGRNTDLDLLRVLVLLLFVIAIKFKQDLGWCLDDDVNQKYAFTGTKCEESSCGLEESPCVQDARGSDDDDCVDDEDWSYTTKEGDVFTCERVAEKTKRCTIRFSDDGVRADDACKKTCGTCP